MVEFPAKSARTNPRGKKISDPPPRGAEKRRSVRLNSRVPIALQWDSGGETHRGETQTRVIGYYGCLVVFRQDLEVDQHIQLTNLASSQSNPAVVVWRGNKRPEGWEVGIELINPEIGFWGLEL
jgi:hypothetical protein